MSLPVPTEPSACGICGDPLRDTDGQAIPTMSGGAVHIRCAEEQARAAARKRAARAALSAVVGVGVWGLVMEAGALRMAGEALPAILLAVLLIGMHVLINRRWWQYTIQSARLWREDVEVGAMRTVGGARSCLHRLLRPSGREGFERSSA